MAKRRAMTTRAGTIKWAKNDGAEGRAAAIIPL